MVEGHYSSQPTMGLDSVELVMEFEKHFQIFIPDLEAEKINTIADATDTILTLVPLHTPERDLYTEIFTRLTTALQEMELTTLPVPATTRMDTLMPETDREKHWHLLEEKIGLQLPSLHPADFQQVVPAETVRFLGMRIGIRRPLPPLLQASLAKLTDYICVLNYQQLIHFNHISSRYEVLISVMGITQDKVGVGVTEMHPGSSFTSDLGID